MTKDTIKTSSSCYLARKQNNVRQIFKESIDSDTKYLVFLQNTEGNFHKEQFTISPAQIGERTPTNKTNEKPYLVVKYLNSNKGYQVTEGDVIKMGRLKFRVKELCGANPSNRVRDFNLQDLIVMKDSSDDSDTEDKGYTFKLPCRICLSERYNDENPLISPCNCDGTMKYIHLRCLQRALRSKLTSRSTESALSFTWKSMSCDLCQRPYPYHFNLNNKMIELIKIPKPPEKYVVLEGLCTEKNSSKWLHVISLNNKDSIKFGRANDCELRMTDISVSRLHGVIKLIGSSFYLEDKSSKFGTLVRIKRPIALDSKEDLVIQCGRTVLEFYVKKPWSFLPSCFKSSSNYEAFVTSPTHGKVFVFPFNTGIPLSIEDPEELKSHAGYSSKSRTAKKNEDNLMFEHGQLGINSSFEEEQMEDVEHVQEVRPAEFRDHLASVNVQSDPAEDCESNEIVQRSLSIA